MRRLLIFLLAYITIGFAAQAGEVTEAQALEKAREFMQGKRFKQQNLRRAPQQEANDFYVFNVEHNEGFVIVSGDDNTIPILGYSDKGNLDMGCLPENTRWWLEGYQKQLEAIKSNNLSAVVRRAGEHEAIAPLIKTHWSQESPYNLHCPMNGDNRSVTGCVATMLAQLLYYYKSPMTSSDIAGYKTTTKEIIVEDLPSTTFQWDKMKLEYESNETGESAEAVAELMRYCGQAMMMDYGFTASSAVIDVMHLLNFTSFSPNMRKISIKDYTYQQWEDILYNELAHQRPVIYEGMLGDPGDGHAFICNGYDGNGMFFINWGWGGNSDGYYVLNIADPQKYGNLFAFNQQAVIRFAPNSEDEVMEPVVSVTNFTCGLSSKMRGSLDVDFDDIGIETRLEAWYLKEPTADYTFEIGLGLYRGSQLVKVLHSRNTNLTTAGDWFEFNYSASVSFGAGLEETEYMIMPIYKLLSSTVWETCKNAYTECVIANIIDTSVNFNKPNTWKQNVGVNSVTVEGNAVEGKNANLIINLTNLGRTRDQVVFLWIRGSNYQWECLGTSVGYLDKDETGDVYLQFYAPAGGTYEAKITGDRLGMYIYKTFELNISYEPVSYCINSIVLPQLPSRGTSNKILLNITNDSEIDRQRVYMWTRLADSEWELCDTWKSAIPPGSSIELSMSFNPSMHGTYEIKFTTDIEGNDIKGTYSLKVGIIEECLVEGIKYACDFTEHKAMLINIDYYDFSQGINIPEQINVNGEDFVVTAIGDGGSSIWQASGTKSTPYIKLPSTIESIGNYAFMDINLTGSHPILRLPEGLQRIGERAFWQCFGVRKAEIPSTLKSVGKQAFGNIPTLTFTVSKMSTPIGIPDDTFTMEMLNKVTSSKLYVPKGSLDAFKNADGWNVFDYILEGDLKEAEVDGLNYAYDTEQKTATVIQGDYSDLKHVIIPASVTIDDTKYAVKDIGYEAFCWRSGYDYTNSYISIEIEPGLESIDDFAFYGRVIQHDLVLPEGIRNIGDFAFCFCNIKYLELPNSLKSIGTRSFYDCCLETIKSLVTTPFDIDDSAFEDGISRGGGIPLKDKKLIVPIGSKYYYQQAEGWSQFQQIYEGEIMQSVIDGLNYEYVTGEDFAVVIKGDYENLVNVDIPVTVEIGGKMHHVKAIDKDAFLSCHSLKYVTLPEGLKIIGSGAFSYNSSLQRVVIPSTVDSIGTWAFVNCNSLEMVISRIENPFVINENVFGIRKVTSVYIDDLASYVEVFDPPVGSLYVPFGKIQKYEETSCWNKFQSIFEGECEIKEAIIDGIKYLYKTNPKVATVMGIFPSGDENRQRLSIPASIEIEGEEYAVKEIGEDAFSNCMNLKSVIIASGIEKISHSAFYNCSLTSISIPEGVKTIGWGAFRWNPLEHIELPSTLIDIGENAFSNDWNPCLISVVNHNSEPIDIQRDVFSNYSNATLYVPEDAINKYSSASVWNNFSNIKPVSEYSINMGDVNRDGNVNVADVVGLISHILGNTNDNFNMNVADINNDGDINVKDVVELIDIIRDNSPQSAPVLDMFKEIDKEQ